MDRIESAETPLPGGWVYESLKRCFDIVAAILGLVFFMPQIPFLMLVVKLETPGPFLFRQMRVGKDGKLFRCYKIRSMVVNAEDLKESLSHLNEADGAAFKIREDPRVTRVGRFVRRSSLDEFPQLLNVLKGEMSIVGPRPQVPSEVAAYTPQQRQRLRVKPGLTCLWQVSGRNDVDFEEWMRMDREYTRRRGIRMDVWILLHTLPAIIARKGAY